MNIFGKSFTYDGIPSSTYNVMLCAFEPPSPSRETALAQTILRGETNPYRAIPNYYASKYTDVLKFDAAIAKCDGTPFLPSERREIMAWLTGPQAPVPFIIQEDDDGYHQGIEYFAKCVNYAEYWPSDSLCGLIFSFECDGPYGYSPEEMTDFEAISGTPAIIRINNTSDERRQDHYPIIELTAGATGMVTITNSVYPDEPLTLSVKNGQQLTIDNRLGLIEDNLDMFDYATDTNLKWVRLAYGPNTLTIDGHARGCVKCRYIRKAGI